MTNKRRPSMRPSSSCSPSVRPRDNAGDLGKPDRVPPSRAHPSHGELPVGLRQAARAGSSLRVIQKEKPPLLRDHAVLRLVGQSASPGFSCVSFLTRAGLRARRPLRDDTRNNAALSSLIWTTREKSQLESTFPMKAKQMIRS